jgi:hypothetical protein
MNQSSQSSHDDPAMSEIIIELQDIVSPNKFIEELYTLVRDRSNRSQVYPDDFLYQAIPISCGEDTVWWFAATHPIALMLRENRIFPCGQHYGPLGRIEIYQGRDVLMCRDSIVGMCNEFGFAVTNEGGSV